MVNEIYRVGVKYDGKTVYLNIGDVNSLLTFLRLELEDAERVSIVKQKLFTLGDEENNC